MSKKVTSTVLTKTEMIRQIALQVGCSQEQAQVFYVALEKVILTGISKGQEVVLQPFGAFKLFLQEARLVNDISHYNRTGKMRRFKKPATINIKFKCYQSFKDAVKQLK